MKEDSSANIGGKSVFPYFQLAGRALPAEQKEEFCRIYFFVSCFLEEDLCHV